MKVKIGVLIPVYNAADTIGETIRSVLDQSVLPYEICIVDDGSTDNSETIVRRFAHEDSSILWKIVQKENGGLGSARNAGLEVMTSDYIAFLDADDKWTKDKLKHVTEFLVQHPDTDLLYHPVWEWSDVNEIMRRRRDVELNSTSDIWLRNPITPSATVVRKEAMKWEFDTDPSIHGVEDALLWSQAMHENKVIRRMRYVDTMYRMNYGMTHNSEEHESHVLAGLAKAIENGWVDQSLQSKIQFHRAYHQARQLHKSGEFREASKMYREAKAGLKGAILNTFAALKIKI